MHNIIGIDRYLRAIVKLSLFANREIKASERELDQWQDEVVELLERVNDERFPPNVEDSSDVLEDAEFKK